MAHLGGDPGRKTEEIKPMGQREVRPTKLFSLPDRRGGRLLERRNHVFYHMRGVWRGGSSLFRGVGAQWLYSGRRAPDEQDENRSVLKLHANQCHNGADVRFSMRVTGVHNDSLDRQVTLPTSVGNF